VQDDIRRLQCPCNVLSCGGSCGTREIPGHGQVDRISVNDQALGKSGAFGIQESRQINQMLFGSTSE
jgi:hypothetical protein